MAEYLMFSPVRQAAKIPSHHDARTKRMETIQSKHSLKEASYNEPNEFTNQKNFSPSSKQS
ncbi:hypothetical protein NRIC_11000 [Enterococcus florum]|uniref:Uncharacterized protein n=1 Tax=Enterococcus florum TaxID=2480627 RepID=A0A4V0WPA8_9ENTE|nr:hypothetical protein NRIC_11000 [Enterococcus florum]